MVEKKEIKEEYKCLKLFKLWNNVSSREATQRSRERQCKKWHFQGKIC